MPMYALCIASYHPPDQETEEQHERCLWCWKNQQTGMMGSINTEGPKFGYLTNAGKTQLVTKEGYLSNIVVAFVDTDVKVITGGRPYLRAALGAVLGTEEYTQAFMTGKVLQQAGELEQLTTIAHSQSHAAYAAFIHGMTSKWTYFTHTMPGIGSIFCPLKRSSEPN